MFQLEALREKARDTSLLVVAAVMAISGAAPFLLQGQAGAATLSTRSVAITSSQENATGVSYAFAFTFPAAQITQSIMFEFCTTPLGTCTKPAGMNVHHDTAQVNATQTFSQTPAFTEVTVNTGVCAYGTTGTGGTNTRYCVSRTGGTSATAETAAAKAITIDSITNPSIPTGNNTEVYVRITTYTDNAFTALNAGHDGTVAAAIVDQLTVTGRVQERLVFCVFALDDTAASAATVGVADGEYPTSCAAAEAVESNNVDIGVIDNLSVARSPVNNSPPASLGNDRFGAAMVNTNASLGVTIGYYASLAGSGTNELRAFRVAGATCNATQPDLTDQCFRSAADNANAGTTITSGVENFGMQIVCVNNSTRAPAAAGTTANLGAGGTGTGAGNSFRTAYANGDATLAQLQTDPSNDCENSEAGNLYAWNDSGTTQALISSNSVVDDELIKLRFGASANATTPTGTYTVSSTFIATPTF